MAVATSTTAARLPGPPELLPGKPDAIVDLQTADGVALVGGQWRYSDARVEEIDFVALGSPEDPLGPGTEPNRTYDVLPHAEAENYDDSGWRVLAPEDTRLRLADGRVCFNWYRIAVTIPERIGQLDPSGSTVVFEVAIDDYAEVWVNGELPHALGDAGGPVVAGFNAANRVIHPRRPPRPDVPDRRVRHQRPDLRLAAQLHLDAHRHARRLHARAGQGGGAGRRADRARGWRLRVHRGPGLVAFRQRAPVQLAQHERDLPLRPRHRAGHGVPLEVGLHRH
jgi:hypothetical protein